MTLTVLFKCTPAAPAAAVKPPISNTFSLSPSLTYIRFNFMLVEKCTGFFLFASDFQAISPLFALNENNNGNVDVKMLANRATSSNCIYQPKI